MGKINKKGEPFERVSVCCRSSFIDIFGLKKITAIEATNNKAVDALPKLMQNAPSKNVKATFLA